MTDTFFHFEIFASVEIVASVAAAVILFWYALKGFSNDVGEAVAICRSGQSTEYVG